MQRFRHLFLLLAVVMCGAQLSQAAAPEVIETKGRLETVATEGPAKLMEMETPDGRLRVLLLKGTHREMGRQYGKLLAADLENALVVFRNLVDRKVYDFGSTYDVVMPVIHKKMSPHIPPRFREEIKGIVEGAKEAGVELDEMLLYSGIYMSNISDAYDLSVMLPRGGRTDAGVEQEHIPSCSFFAAWGSRTEGGKLYASRDLDWMKRTGMSDFKLVTVYAPVGSGGQALNGYVSVGAVGMTGALAGMNETGIAIAEVGAVNSVETLEGTPWTLMMRDILERASDLEEARRIMGKTRKTVGYNFMLADGDADGYGGNNWSPGALAVETNASHTIFFEDNDPRDKGAKVVDKNGEVVLKDGKPVFYGFALEDAVFRADVALAKEIRKTQKADNGPIRYNSDGDPRETGAYRERYELQYRILRGIEEGREVVRPDNGEIALEAGAPRKMGVGDAMLLTAEAAAPNTNIISVMYSATDLDFRVAFESTVDGEWSAAPQSGYYKFNLGSLVNSLR